MNKLILSNDDIEFLLKWRDNHKNLVRMYMTPIHAIKVICKESKYVITAVADGTMITFNISNQGKSLGKFKIDRIKESGMCELVFDKSKLSEDDKQSVITVYFSAMAFLLYGKETIGSYDIEIKAREPIADRAHRNQRCIQTYNRSRSYTYVISREFSDKLHIPKKHKSPSCEFSVRGHFRHYKDGRTVWISQYIKGKGKSVSTKYKLKPSKLIINIDNND